MHTSKAEFSHSLNVWFSVSTLLGAVASLPIIAAQAPKAPTPLTLQVAVITTAKSSGSWLAFTVTNHSTEPLEAVGPNADPYSFLITMPDGSTFKNFSVIDGGGPRPTIAPGESKTWEMNARDVVDIYERWGLFRLTWQIWRREGKDVVIYKSNEILLLKNPPPDTTPK